jgi:hypothetical protein
MHVLKSVASQCFVEHVQALEGRADLCYEGLELVSKNSWNVGTWASLVRASEKLESIPRAAYGGKSHLIMLINLSRIIPVMCAWCRDHSDPKTAPVSKFQWTRARQMSSSTAFDVAARYFAFCATFPAWHRDLVSARMFEANGVEFISTEDSDGRRVSAYQKGLGPPSADSAGGLPSVERSPEMENLIVEALGTVRSHGLEIDYPKPEQLLKHLNNVYQNRLAQAFRRYEGISVGRYSLREFRTVYAALLAVASTHEHICFRWSIGRRFPFESAVLHHAKREWLDMLCHLSAVPGDVVAAIVDDLTLGATKLWDLMVHPFVALDDDKRRLGLLPHFVLASNSEENILRACSLIRPRFHNAASAEKEAEMRDQLRLMASPFRLSGPIKLRSDLPDIDLVVEDSTSSTVAICELKWGRKPYTVVERISRNAELTHGARQLEMIQRFLEANPDFLQRRGCLAKGLRDYRRIEYLLVARDHLKWIPPSGRRAVVGFNPFKASLKKTDLASALNELLSYRWLPTEGKDFKVEFQDPTVNGVTMRSEIFYPL